MGDTAKDVFLITEQKVNPGEPVKNIWTKIGIAFVNRDDSLNVMLDALPLSGKLHIRSRRDSKTSYQKQN